MSILIYAELSKKQYHSILNGEYTISIPYNTSMTNHKRGLHFTCETEESKEELISALESDGINWTFDKVY